MTKMEMVQMGIEFRENYYGKYHVEVEHTYKYRGEIKSRTELVMTEEGREISHMLDEPMFKCPECGELVSFNELESWLADDVQDFIRDEVPCSCCYEDDMGEDL